MVDLGNQNCLLSLACVSDAFEYHATVPHCVWPTLFVETKEAPDICTSLIEHLMKLKWILSISKNYQNICSRYSILKHSTLISPHQFCNYPPLVLFIYQLESYHILSMSIILYFVS